MHQIISLNCVKNQSVMNKKERRILCFLIRFVLCISPYIQGKIYFIGVLLNVNKDIMDHISFCEGPWSKATPSLDWPCDL